MKSMSGNIMSKASGGAFGRRGFSTLEVLVVAGVLVLLLAVAARAVSGVVYSSQRSLAENQLRAALASARDAAIGSQQGDVGAVFFFRDGRTQVIPCVRVGEISDIPMNYEGVESTSPPKNIEVFVPVDGARAVQMPRGWTVRGYAPAGSLHTASSQAGTGTPNENGWYDWIDSAPNVNTLLQGGVWVFPETDFVPSDAQGVFDDVGDQGWRRQTFMIRFAAQSGEAMIGDTRLVIVVDPLEAEYRFNGVFQGNDVLQGESLAQRVRKILSGAASVGPPLTIDQQRELLGDRSTDTVLTRSIAEFALTDERRLANAIGARALNRDTQSLYRVIEPNATGDANIPLDASLFGGTLDEAVVMRRIGDYVGRRAGQGAGELDEGTVFEARVFTMSRYLGQVQEIVDR